VRDPTVDGRRPRLTTQRSGAQGQRGGGHGQNANSVPWYPDPLVSWMQNEIGNVANLGHVFSPRFRSSPGPPTTIHGFAMAASNSRRHNRGFRPASRRTDPPHPGGPPQRTQTVKMWPEPATRGVARRCFYRRCGFRGAGMRKVHGSAQHRRGGKVSTGHDTLYTAVLGLAVGINPGGGRAPRRDRGEYSFRLRRKR
jgi:hypothetical protein